MISSCAWGVCAWAIAGVAASVATSAASSRRRLTNEQFEERPGDERGVAVADAVGSGRAGERAAIARKSRRGVFGAIVCAGIADVGGGHGIQQHPPAVEDLRRERLAERNQVLLDAGFDYAGQRA